MAISLADFQPTPEMTKNFWANQFLGGKGPIKDTPFSYIKLSIPTIEKVLEERGFKKVLCSSLVKNINNTHSITLLLYRTDGMEFTLTQTFTDSFLAEIFDPKMAMKAVVNQLMKNAESYLSCSCNYVEVEDLNIYCPCNMHKEKLL